MDSRRCPWESWPAPGWGCWALCTPEMRALRSPAPGAAPRHGARGLQHTHICKGTRGTKGGVRAAGALRRTGSDRARTGSTLSEHREQRGGRSATHTTRAAPRGLPAPGSRCPVPGDGSRQQEQPQEALIHSGIWAKRCLLQALSSQDIPKKPLERWGGKLLEVFGRRKQKSSLDFQGKITEEEKNVFNLIKSNVVTFTTTPRTCARSELHAAIRAASAGAAWSRCGCSQDV